jgi:glycerate kinase
MGEEANKVYDYGISSIMTTVNRDMDIKEALDRAEELLIDAVDRMCRFIAIGMGIGNL